jgi:PUB domain
MRFASSLFAEVAAGAAGRAGPEVKVTLMISPGGLRVEGSYPCNTTTVGGVLVDMAAKGLFNDVPGYSSAFPTGDDAASFVSGADNTFDGCSVVYVRSTLKGKDLATTTLAGFGLIKGAAGLRVTLPPAPGVAGGGSVASPTASAGASSSAVVAVSAQVTVEAQAATSVTTTTTAASPTAASSAQPALAAATAPTSEAMVVESPATAASTTSGEGNAPASTTAAGRSHGVSPAEVSATTAASSEQPAPVLSSASSQEPASKRPKLGEGGEYSASAGSTRAGLEPMQQPPAASSVPAPSVPAVGGSSMRLRNAVGRVNSAIERLRASCFDADSKQALKLAVTVLDNLLLRPDEAKVRTIKFSNQRFYDVLGQFPAGVDVLRAAGFEERDESIGGMGAGAGAGAGGSSNRVLILSPEDEHDDLTIIVRETLAKAIMAHFPGELVPPTPSVNYAAREAGQQAKQTVEAVFDPYKSSVIKPTGEIAPTAASGSTLPSSAATAAAGPGAGAPSSSSSSAASSSSAMAVDGEGEALTHTDRKVLSLKQKTLEIQKANRPPSDRSTVVLLYGLYQQLQAHLQATAASSSSASSASMMEEDQPAAATAAIVDDDSNDPEAAALMMEYARKKMAEQARLAKNDGAPLTTAAQRELEALEKAKIFTQTVIKVQLPMLASSSSAAGASAGSQQPSADQRVVFKGVFSPLDTIADLCQWVESLLHPTNVIAAGLPFYLYSSPPPQQYSTSTDCDSDKRTLQEAKLVPAKLLYLSFGAGLGKSRLTPGEALSGSSAAVPLTLEDMLSPTQALEKGKALLRYANENPAMAVGQDLDSLASAFSSSTMIPASNRAIDLASAQLPSSGGLSGGVNGGSSELDEAALEKMAQALLSGESTSLSSLSSKATAGAGGAGAGTGSAGTKGKFAGKPSWLKL